MIKKFFSPLFLRHEGSILALDGIRSFAILMVIAFHAQDLIFQVHQKESFLSKVPPYIGGWAGVPLFFALSGYLIGKQVWKELKVTQTLEFWPFFFKRAFRIWPLFYFLFFLFWLFPYRENVTDYWQNAFFLSNYFGDNGPIPGSWSLATEEQFYLLLPMALGIFSVISGKRFMLSHWRKLLLGLLLLPPLFRVLTWYYILKMDHFDVSVFNLHIYRPFHTHADSLLMGLILANFEIDRGLKKIDGMKPWIFLGSTFLFGVLSFKSKVFLNFFGVGLFATTLIWFCLITENILTKFLSHPFFGVISKLSFGMYLIHWPCYYLMKKCHLVNWVGIPLEIELVLVTLIGISFSIIFSSLNYLLIEKPFLDIRKKLLT
ncbi:MAG: acyltransferase family protein [Bacteriovoracaceae bacterium]